ncbi:Rieske Fe-S protein [Bradyrhizobium sp. USDA 4538]|uniref:QcrA and Rieske domain-containing protein n=1 Tax=unclassified Bradyrhizobium TaxID=2631580 RepID=UPI0020A177AB|nr:MULTISPECIES: Rieske (2Fe-2S) protein [unclassified Bradyrhizobium]MCP1845160.1 Rieske Fe-S protein [Bradyrhizobium sp. USDA 4538]MCP1905725.1 Rieske Fe-S protein [Bradyrhizobium sp. USDA 4537]MCP1988619.1 Rieske Fe-S protein [Bradyrhizobium sp. USDA 4539]
MALAPLLMLAGPACTAEEGEAAKPPAPDDRFAFLTGPKKGEVVRAEDLALGGPQVQAYPMAPDGTVRSDNRLNLVILARFDPAALSDETRARAADGVVAYSAICTHQGCPVNAWSKERNALVCSCHASIFDPRNAAEVIGGPAPRPLAALGLKLKDGVVTVASTFSGRVGATQG